MYNLAENPEWEKVRRTSCLDNTAPFGVFGILLVMSKISSEYTSRIILVFYEQPRWLQFQGSVMPCGDLKLEKTIKFDSCHI